jgi:uncharacterized membrane protein
MTGFLFFVLAAILLIRLVLLSSRYRELGRRIDRLADEKVDATRLATLVSRVWQLEKSVAELQGDRPAVLSQPEPRHAEQASSPETVQSPGEPPAEAPLPAHEPRPAFAPSLGMAAETSRSRASRTSGEWEALVGGNWLNKLGVFVLVIAIALFLGYSFSKMGPAGRSAVGLAISLALLAAGIALERRAEYVIFARGLLGGGWAALYFTVYAMQAVEAAKVLDNPLLGGFLLLTVATGMVLHSLRYRNQALTAFAYFVAFATLAITPVTGFSVIALIPLAASLLLVAHRFAWPHLALFGVIATYATCASRGDNGAPLRSAQAVFATYWLVFETYDVLRAWRRSNHPTEQPIFTLNALGFGLLSWAKWSAAAPESRYQLAAGVAVAYLVSTVLRILLRPPASFASSEGTPQRILAGGFEGPLTLAAACSAASVALKLHGQTVNNVLLAEGELLFLAGLFFQQVYLRKLAGALFAALGLKLLLADIPGAGTIVLAGHVLKDWTPSAAFAAALFYCNRGLHRRGSVYSYAGSALVVLILGFEVSLRNVGIAWLVFGALLFAIGWRFRLFDFRMQSYVSGVLGLCAVALYQAQYEGGFAETPAHPWISLAVATGIAALAAQFVRHSAPGRLMEEERRVVGYGAGGAAIAASAALLWRIVPGSMLTVTWGMEGVLLLMCGFPLRDRTLRLSGIVLFLICVGKLFLYDLRNLETLYRIFSFFVLGIILVGVSWLYTHFRNQIQRYW